MPRQPEADLVLEEIQRSCRLRPTTIHGLLWIQTHFETSAWDLVCSGDVRINWDSSHALGRDAAAAGLQVEWITAGSAPSRAH